MKPGFVYLMANHRRGQTYLGVTSGLPQRAWQHRNKIVEGHSKEKNCTLLVWFEAHDDLQEARRRELQMKKWKRVWKIALIEEANPDWKDLYDSIFEAAVLLRTQERCVRSGTPKSQHSCFRRSTARQTWLITISTCW